MAHRSRRFLTSRRALRALRALACLAAALAAAGASAQTFAPRAEQGSTHRYEIRTRFAPTMHQPTRGDFQTVVDMTIRSTFFVSVADGRRMVLRMRIDALKFEYIQDTGGSIVGLSFDSDIPEEEEDPRNEAAALRDAVGQTVELFIDSDGDVADLRDVLWPVFPDDTAGRMVKRLIGEGMIDTAVEWIFDLPPDEGELDTGDAFNHEFVVLFGGDGEMRFIPRFVLDGQEDGEALFTIGGGAEYTDDRPPLAVLGGRPVMAIDEASIEGDARWRAELGVLAHLDLTAYARIEPAQVDPLGRRIERRSVEERFVVRRLDSPAGNEQ